MSKRYQIQEFEYAHQAEQWLNERVEQGYRLVASYGRPIKGGDGYIVLMVERTNEIRQP